MIMFCGGENNCVVTVTRGSSRCSSAFRETAENHAKACVCSIPRLWHKTPLCAEDAAGLSAGQVRKDRQDLFAEESPDQHSS